MEDIGHGSAQDAQQHLDTATPDRLASKGYWPDKCGHDHPVTAFFQASCSYKHNEVGGENSTFIQLLRWTGDQREELEKMVEEEMSLSEEAAFEQHVVRYRDYVPGTSLLITERLPYSFVMPEATTLTDEDFLNMAWHALQALASLHSRGVVHGDICPRNIIYFPGATDDDDGTYKLLGHGLVPKVAGHEEALGALYTAPELRGKPYKPTFQSDVWMLGVTLFTFHQFGFKARDETLSKSGIEELVEQLSNGNYDRHLPKHKEIGCASEYANNHTTLENLLRGLLAQQPRKRASAMAALDGFASEMFPVKKKAAMVPVNKAIKAAKEEEVRDRTLAGKVFGRMKRFWDWLLLLGVALMFAFK
ncbi:CAMK family protein kinase [Colletotrichum musicola]|uniref:CAMK family protein kinase n=1 Tax=Colletotrichum musicola TaxID=2175873 RepID=A0A8H6KTV8_9PEZI|nr:CAMK family protein kinase [Colletotrichum musicola]